MIVARIDNHIGPRRHVAGDARVARAVGQVMAVGGRIGDDLGMAVANSLAAVRGSDVSMHSANSAADAAGPASHSDMPS